MFLVFMVVVTGLWGQVTLKVTSVPPNSPPDMEIFVAGNFQGWNPGDPDYRLTDNGDGTWEIVFSPAPGTLEYKFTRGTWATVEGNANGGFLPNRTLVYTGAPVTEEVDILSWEDVGGSNSTAAVNVQVWASDFYMPQLDRTRRIWVYLPPDYDTTQKKYPVLYMHDGQNCFDSATAFAGEWEVDESLNKLFDEGDYGCIVVGIDNGGTHRIDEYSPWNNPAYGGGEGDAYLDFVVQTLKPVIDATFRTLPGRDFTAIMGSSMGGLISHYALLKYQDVFSKAGIFSPSYWIVKDEVFDFTENTPKTNPLRAYLIIGALEGASAVNDVNDMTAVMLNNGFDSSEISKTVHGDGQHSEWYWAREFPAAYQWLFGGVDFTNVGDAAVSAPEIFPNPSAGALRLRHWESLPEPAVEIVTTDGRVVYGKTPVVSGDLALPDLPAGTYIVKVWSKNRVVAVRKWVRAG